MASFVLLPQFQLALSLVLQLFLPAQHSSLEVQSPAVMPAFLAPNKSPAKSRVFSKPFR
jgi:hypothetical protein